MEVKNLSQNQFSNNPVVLKALSVNVTINFAM